ncbi:MAG: LptF/LptG family permease [Bacteriovoracaceae bacterium]
MFRGSILVRYIASSFILPFIVTLIFVLTFLLTVQMFRIVSLVMNTGVPLRVVMELIGHLIIYTLPIALPLAILFSTLFLFNRLSLDSEYTAMRSFGLSKHKIFLPVLIMGILISLTVSEISKNLIPYSTSQFRHTLAYLTSKGYITSIKEGNFFTDIPGLTLFAEKVENEGTDLSRIFINFKNARDQDSFERTIFAARGKLLKINENEIGAASLRLKLFDGNIIKLDGEGKELEKILFKEYDFPITNGALISGAAVKDSMRTNKELRDIIGMPEKARDEKGISIKDFISAKIEYYSRYNTALQCLVFILIGFVLGIQPTRGKGRNTGLMTLAVVVIYYGIFFFGVTFAKSGKIDPLITTFLPTILTTSVGLWLYSKLDWIH